MLLDRSNLKVSLWIGGTDLVLVQFVLVTSASRLSPMGPTHGSSIAPGVIADTDVIWRWTLWNGLVSGLMTQISWYGTPIVGSLVTHEAWGWFDHRLRLGLPSQRIKYGRTCRLARSSRWGQFQSILHDRGIVVHLVKQTNSEKEAVTTQKGVLDTHSIQALLLGTPHH